MSDYHHLKPAIWKKRVSTCQFAQPRANRHGRSVSRFTVISNAADTETDTDKSYDPYRGSRMLQRCDSEVSHAKIVIHRDVQGTPNASQTARRRSGSNAQRGRASSVRTSMTAMQSSRGSLASLRSNRQGISQVAAPSLRHKRGVDFTHIRKRSSSAGPAPKTASTYAEQQVDLGKGYSHLSQTACPSTPEVLKLLSGTYPRTKRVPSTRIITWSGVSMIFNEELRHFSNNCAKDCDKAFRSPLIQDDFVGGSWTDGERKHRDSTPFSLALEGPTVTTPATDTSGASWQSRPLPKLPVQGASKRCIATVSYEPDYGIHSSDERDDDGDLLVDEVPRLAVSVLLPRQGERRVASAPAYGQATRKLSTLPSINENAGIQPPISNDGTRIVSAPPRESAAAGCERERCMAHLSRVENSIRVVHSPGAQSAVHPPKPLNIRKKTVMENFGRKLQCQLAYNAEHDDDAAEPLPREANVPVKKKMSWFKRSSKTEAEPNENESEPGSATSPAAPMPTPMVDVDLTCDGAKKRVFSFPFWKSNKQRDSKMAIRGELEPPTTGTRRAATQELTWAAGQAGHGEGRRGTKLGRDAKHRPDLPEWGSGSTRNIAVKQNWLARLFRIKPATSYICMTLSRRRARQEVAILLREWRRYGIRGIQVDKQRNLVFARLGAKNCTRPAPLGVRRKC